MCVQILLGIGVQAHDGWPGAVISVALTRSTSDERTDHRCSIVSWARGESIEDMQIVIPIGSVELASTIENQARSSPLHTLITVAVSRAENQHYAKDQMRIAHPHTW